MADAVKIVTRTIYGAALQTSQTLKTPHQIREFTTINEALNVPDIVPYQPNPMTAGAQIAQSYNAETDTNKLATQYWCIGNGGHSMVSKGEKAIPLPITVVHRSNDACLYEILPFVVKPIDQDLTREQRVNYRLRKILMIDGEYYVAYFARKLPTQELASKMLHTKVQDGVPATVEFIPSVNNLNPARPTIGQENDGSFLSVSSSVLIDFTEQDVNWLKEACEILYGSAEFAIISEIAICSGIDKVVQQEYPLDGTQTSTNIANQNIMEAVGVQVTCFMNPFYSAISGNQGFGFELDLGAAEPLFSSN